MYVQFKSFSAGFSRKLGDHTYLKAENAHAEKMHIPLVESSNGDGA